MQLLIICAQCSNEFEASGDDRFWKCPLCGHDVENMQFPFLTRKIAHAKAHRAEADWETLFDELLKEARQKVIELQSRVRRLEEESRKSSERAKK